jgi:hypothetical protein
LERLGFSYTPDFVVLGFFEEYLRLPESEREGLYDGHRTPKGARVTAQLLAEVLRTQFDVAKAQGSPHPL